MGFVPARPAWISRINEICSELERLPRPSSTAQRLWTSCRAKPRLSAFLRHCPWRQWHFDEFVAPRGGCIDSS